MRLRFLALPCTCWLLLGLATSPAHAATSTAALTVSTTVLSLCTIDAASPPANSRATLTVACSLAVPYNVDLGTRTGTSVPATRQASEDGNTGRYKLPLVTADLNDTVTATITY